MKLDLFNRLNLKTRIFLIASIIAVIVTVWYLLSGQGTLDQNLVKLQGPDSQIQNISIKNKPQGAKQITIQCDNGSSYDIYLPPGERNFSAVKNNLCNR